MVGLKYQNIVLSFNSYYLHHTHSNDINAGLRLCDIFKNQKRLHNSEKPWLYNVIF